MCRLKSFWQVALSGPVAPCIRTHTHTPALLARMYPAMTHAHRQTHRQTETHAHESNLPCTLMGTLQHPLNRHLRRLMNLRAILCTAQNCNARSAVGGSSAQDCLHSLKHIHSLTNVHGPMQYCNNSTPCLCPYMCRHTGQARVNAKRAYILQALSEGAATILVHQVAVGAACLRHLPHIAVLPQLGHRSSHSGGHVLAACPIVLHINQAAMKSLGLNKLSC